ncbi:hypothetical protein C8T65DRAFT_662712 [Cerioporus squamosus]|nr:hypothetical protein C8T65DRAFT_662712 [Cerioporus squamosus]
MGTGGTVRESLRGSLGGRVPLRAGWPRVRGSMASVALARRVECLRSRDAVHAASLQLVALGFLLSG